MQLDVDTAIRDAGLGNTLRVSAPPRNRDDVYEASASGPLRHFREKPDAGTLLQIRVRVLLIALIDSNSLFWQDQVEQNAGNTGQADPGQ